MLDKRNEPNLEGLDLKIYEYLRNTGAVNRDAIIDALNIARTTCYDHLDKLHRRFDLITKFSKITLKRGKPPTLWCLKKDKEKYFVDHPYKKPILDLLRKFEVLSTTEINEKIPNLKEISVRNALRRFKKESLIDSFGYRYSVYWHLTINLHTKEYYLDLIRTF